MQRNVLLNVAAVAATVVAVVAVGFTLRREFMPSTGVSFSTRNDWRSFADTGLRMGAAAAPVQVTFFGDPFCVHCGRAWTSVAALRDSIPESISVVFRHFPFTALSRGASLALECAHEQNRFSELFRIIENRDSLELSEQIVQNKWSSIASLSGVVDTLAFGACMRSPSTDSLVARDLASGTRLKVTVLPTILVNEALVQGNPGPEAIRKLVRDRLPH